MELEKLQEIVEFMKKNGVSELMVEDTAGKVSLKRETAGGAVPAGPAAPAAAVPAAASPDETARAKDTGVPIESPLVGTFYRSSSPDADPFVKVGSRVDAKTVVCIIEAMKVMNEIRAGVSGRVAKVLAENGSAVQFGQKLFLVEPE